MLERQVLDRLVLARLQLARARDSGIRVSDGELAQAIESVASRNRMTQEQLRARLVQETGEAAGGTVLSVPQSSIQTVDGRPVVFVAGDDGIRGDLLQAGLETVAAESG